MCIDGPYIRMDVAEKKESVGGSKNLGPTFLWWVHVFLTNYLYLFDGCD